MIKKTKKPSLGKVVEDSINNRISPTFGGGSLITKAGLRASTGDFVGDSLRQHALDQRLIPKPRATYIKANSTVAQKKLLAQWAFPVARLEEFLDIFKKAAYNVIVNRLGYHQPVCSGDEQIAAELNKHPKDARVTVSAINAASYSAFSGCQSSPDYAEVDYFFWIVKGIVYFGCVLPSSEVINGLTGATFWESKQVGIKWVKNPFEIKKDGKRGSAQCPEGVISSYVKMVSFYPGQMVGISEFVSRMVKNPKERVWAINYAIRKRVEETYTRRMMRGQQLTNNTQDVIQIDTNRV